MPKVKVGSTIPKNVRRVYGATAHAAAAQGWKIELTQGNHVRWTSPSGRVIFSAASPSDHRAIRNTVAMLRREGFRG